MIPAPRQCRLERRDPARNMARFYTLAIEPSLFGGAALVRQWGRIGTRGQLRIDLFASEREAECALARLAAAKTRRGYRLPAHTAEARRYWPRAAQLPGGLPPPASRLRRAEMSALSMGPGEKDPSCARSVKRLR